MMFQDSHPPPTSWPYVRTPQGLYWLVMAPICLLQLFLIVTRTPGWLRVSAAVVIALTIYGYLRSYVRRLVLTPQGATLQSLLSRRSIDWRRVRSVGRYVPGGGLGATPYLFITTRDRIPAGKWEIDEETIQVQDRPGLLEAVERYRDAVDTQQPQ